MIVAIDGPAGSGKSTVARTIARKHGFTYLDTGAMYRCVALEALESGVPLDDQKALEDLAEGASISFGRAADGSQTVVLDGRDVTCAIRTPEVDRAVSAVSSVHAVAPSWSSGSARRPEAPTSWPRGATSAQWCSLRPR